MHAVSRTPGLACQQCVAIYYYDDGNGNAVSPIASKAYDLTVGVVKAQYEAPDVEETDLVQEDAPPDIQTSTADQIADPKRVAKYGSCTHGGTQLRVSMRMITSHYLRAWCWHNHYKDHERVAAAARGVHPIPL